ncbi:MAG: T9SS type A sorting domain-containing protein, partial [Flavobacteriales bacterium]|nr:T9SS type A sorting domain-containing protein [Flavobacteriales bacterium]
TTYFQLYDLAGRLINSIDIGKELPYTFSRSGLQAGIYLYEITIHDNSKQEPPEIYKGKLVLTSE